jgi:hypothetical protein
MDTHPLRHARLSALRARARVLSLAYIQSAAEHYRAWLDARRLRGHGVAEVDAIEKCNSALLVLAGRKDRFCAVLDALDAEGDADFAAQLHTGTRVRVEAALRHADARRARWPEKGGIVGADQAPGWAFDGTTVRGEGHGR